MPYNVPTKNRRDIYMNIEKTTKFLTELREHIYKGIDSIDFF